MAIRGPWPSVSLMQSCCWLNHEVCNYLKKAHIKWKNSNRTDHVASRQFNTRATQLPPALTSCCILQSGGLGGDRTDGQGQVPAVGARAGGLVLLRPGGQDLPASRPSSALSLTES